MDIYQLSAILAAVSWAGASLVSAGPSSKLGAIAFNRTRMLIVFVMLAVWSASTGNWQSIEANHWNPLLLSGIIGILLGDTALFLTLNRMGPRRTAVLFAINAPIAVLLGWVWLGETISALEFLGIALVFCGVVLAIIFGKRRSQMHKWENVQGNLIVGIVIGVLAALCQAVGAIIARPIMESGVDAASASAVRVGVATIGLYAISLVGRQATTAKIPMTNRLFLQVCLSGFLGMGVGMTLLLFALEGGKVGIVTSLSATTPAIILPMLWLTTGERPAAMAWLGAGLAVIGSAMLFV